ncbi:helix-turn-helix domain-containing protein [Lonsdalea quercina]|uniref:helix-turn-helix domain-containing protein n=1 Tax=Lonsdalea quercina TaxID=71657 RepID=UPI003974ADE9
MKKLYDYIEAMKRHTRLNTNIKIADYLEVSRQYITTLKYGKSWLSLEKCLDIAAALGIDVTEILMTINAEKSQSLSDKERFYKLAEQNRSPINPPESFKPDGSPRRRPTKKKKQ